jgi:hypothetical protein
LARHLDRSSHDVGIQAKRCEPGGATCLAERPLIDYAVRKLLGDFDGVLAVNIRQQQPDAAATRASEQPALARLLVIPKLA